MKREYLPVFVFIVIFEGLLVYLTRADLSVLESPFLLTLLGLASYRGGRAVAFNYIFEWLRAPFSETSPDSSGAGMSTNPVDNGIRKGIGELLCCPICAGTWVALMLSGLIILYYPFGYLLTFILAAAGIGEFLHWFSEMTEWRGREARENAGLQYRNQEWISENENLLEVREGEIH